MQKHLIFIFKGEEMFAKHSTRNSKLSNKQKINTSAQLILSQAIYFKFEELLRNVKGLEAMSSSHWIPIRSYVAIQFCKLGARKCAQRGNQKLAEKNETMQMKNWPLLWIGSQVRSYAIKRKDININRIFQSIQKLFLLEIWTTKRYIL